MGGRIAGEAWATEWERRTGISRHTLLARERLGWPVEEIFSKRDTRFKSKVDDG